MLISNNKIPIYSNIFMTFQPENTLYSDVQLKAAQCKKPGDTFLCPGQESYSMDTGRLPWFLTNSLGDMPVVCLKILLK